VERRVPKLLSGRGILKTAALCDERGGEEHREGRAARNFSEEKSTCSQSPRLHYQTKISACRIFLFGNKVDGVEEIGSRRQGF